MGFLERNEVNMAAYSELALNCPATVTGCACRAISVYSTRVVWSCARGIEATIGPAPYAALPVGADGEVHGCFWSELEAGRAGAGARLGEDCGIDDFATPIFDEQRFASRVPRRNPCRRSSSHVV